MILVLCWLVLLGGMVAPSQAAVTAPFLPARGPDEVVIGMSEEPDTLNPLFAERAAADAVLATMFTIDVQRDNLGSVFPQGVVHLPTLADGSWTVVGDTMALRWRIRARNWQDGTAVTCGDYRFAHSAARDARVPVARRGVTNRIADVGCTAGDDGVDMTVTWNERYAYANQSVTEYGALPRHVLEPIFRASPSALRDAAYGADALATVGDGAYKLVEWQGGVFLTVESVGPHPIFGTPRIKRITWRVLSDSNALVSNMLSGAIDAVSAVGVSFDQALHLERQSAGRVTVFFEPGLIWEHIDFNLDNPLLQDVRVRRAVVHGIDRQAISLRLFDGRQPVAHTYLPPRHPGHTDAVQKYPYDPERARALLQQAGFTPGPDGTMRNAAGERLTLELTTTAGDGLREQVERSIQHDLKAIGIETTIRNVPGRVYFSRITTQRRFTGLAMYAWALSPISDCNGLYTSDGIPSERNGWSGQNYPGYRSAEMDRVCRAAAGSLDPAARVALLRRSAAIFAKDLPAIPLYVRAVTAAAKVGLLNFAPTGSGRMAETWNAARWAWR